MQLLVDGLQALVQEAKVRVEREAAALPAWSGCTEPVSAETQPWTTERAYVTAPAQTRSRPAVIFIGPPCSARSIGRAGQPRGHLRVGRIRPGHEMLFAPQRFPTFTSCVVGGRMRKISCDTRSSCSTTAAD